MRDTRRHENAGCVGAPLGMRAEYGSLDDLAASTDQATHPRYSQGDSLAGVSARGGMSHAALANADAYRDATLICSFPCCVGAAVGSHGGCANCCASYLSNRRVPAAYDAVARWLGLCHPSSLYCLCVHPAGTCGLLPFCTSHALACRLYPCHCGGHRPWLLLQLPRLAALHAACFVAVRLCWVVCSSVDRSPMVGVDIRLGC